MTGFFLRVMEFSGYGAVWIVMLLLADKLVRKGTGALWKYLVAVCIILHLLVPVHIQWIALEAPGLQKMESSLYAKSSLQETGTNTQDVPGKIADKATGEVEVAFPAGELAEGSLEGKVENAEIQSEETERKPLGADGEIEERTSKATFLKEKLIRDLKKLLMSCWLLGTVWLLIRTWLAYVSFYRLTKRWSLPVNPLAEQVLCQVKSEYGIRRKISLRRSEKVSAPILCGIWKPVILLPEGEYQEAEYIYIFRHELCHYRHGDIVMKYIITLCRGIYWFHPLVRLLCRYACAQMEFLCDEAVVGGKEIQEKKAYSEVLLKHMLTGKMCKEVPLTTGFYGRKECTKMRFRNIMSTTTTRRKASLTAAVLAAIAVLVFGGVKWGNAAGETNSEASLSDKEGITEVKGREESYPVKTYTSQIEDKRILLIGTDKGGFADAIILVNVQAENKSILIENIPRDLCVDIKELKEKGAAVFKGVEGEKIKLSSAYAAYGYGVLVGAVEKAYQVDVDSHLVVDFEVARQMVDAVGGVPVTLTKKEAAYLNETNFISEKKNRNVKAGTQLLNGDQALGYMRIRKWQAGSPVVDGKVTDEKETFARGSRWNNVILGLASQLKKGTVSWKDVTEVLVKGWLDTQIDVGISLEELKDLMDMVCSGKLSVMVSKQRSSEDYTVIQDEEAGQCLRLEELRQAESAK